MSVEREIKSAKKTEGLRLRCCARELCVHLGVVYPFDV